MDQPSASWSALFRGRLAAYTTLMTLAVGAHAIGIHMRNTVMPSVVDDIGGAAYYTWALMLYTIASIIATACGGRLQSALGMRSAYLIGCAVVLGGALGCATASRIVIFLIASATQGLGSGLLMSLGYAMVGSLYPEALRPRILSASSGMWGLAAFLGPTLGGLFAGMGWWRGAFWCFAPGLLALSLLAWHALPPANEAQPLKRLPGLRLALLAAGVIAIASSGRVDLPGVRIALLLGACALAGLTFHFDTRAADRLFPSRPLSLMTAVGVASWMFVMFGMTTGQVTVFMPLVAQTLYGMSPLGAGYFTAVLSFSWTILALCSAGWTSRRARLAVLLGPPVIAIGVIGLGLSVVAGSLPRLGVLLSLVGAGIGVCFAHISSWAIAAGRVGEEGLTASSIPMLQSLGIAFGVSIAGLAANMAGLASGVSTATVAAAAAWVYTLSMLAPVLLTVLALRLARLHRQAQPTSFSAAP